MFDIFAESREQARSEAIPWGELEGKRVLITGATGLIGFACARLLLERNRLGLGSQIGVLCLVRNEGRAREVFSAYDEDDGLEMIAARWRASRSPRAPSTTSFTPPAPRHRSSSQSIPSRRPMPWCWERGACWSWRGRRAAPVWCALPAWRPMATAMPRQGFRTCWTRARWATWIPFACAVATQRASAWPSNTAAPTPLNTASPPWWYAWPRPSAPAFPRATAPVRHVRAQRSGGGGHRP